jgi:hypothetical protein
VDADRVKARLKKRCSLALDPASNQVDFWQNLTREPTVNGARFDDGGISWYRIQGERF